MQAANQHEKARLELLVNGAVERIQSVSDRLVLHKHGGVASGSATAATSSTNAFNNDHKIMRISEMYLIKAECRAAANDFAGAATAIDAIRDARFGSDQAAPVYGNVTAAWKGVLDERRLELAFEGHRFFDLKRFNLGINRLDSDVLLNTFAQTLDAGDYRFTLPIPQAAIFANENLVQNPQY